MSGLYDATNKALMVMLLKQMALQMQVIELQQQVIELQQRIDEMTPKAVPSDALWHIKTGTQSPDVSKITDLALLEKFRDWNYEFGERHIKPYVNPKAYMECLHQMTRGIPLRIAELQMRDYETSKLARRAAATASVD